MQPQIWPADPDKGRNQKDAHHHHQDIGSAPGGEIEGQMMRAHRMNLLVQLSLLETTLAARDSWAECLPPVRICLIWIKGTMSTSPSLMATLKQNSHSGALSHAPQHR